MDYYPTPAWCVDVLFDTIEPPPGLIIEPSAGDGAIIRRVNEIDDLHYHWFAIEIQQRFHSTLMETVKHGKVLTDDFLEPTLQRVIRGCCARDRVSMVGNPPYEIALKFCEAALSHPIRYLAFLLRLDFLGSKGRCSFFRKYPLSKLVVLSRRPKFKGGTGTDLYNYGWFVWARGDYGEPLFPTPQIVVV